MSDEKAKDVPFVPAPMEPPPPAHPSFSDGDTPAFPAEPGPLNRRPYEGYYYKISRKGQQQTHLRESPARKKQLNIGDTLIIDTACAVACWVYVVESDTKLGKHTLKMYFHTDGFRKSHEHVVSNKFDKLRIIFSDSEIHGISVLSTASDDESGSNPTGWLQNLDRFNPSGAIGGRGHGPILTPEENSMAPKFSFGPSPKGTVQIQEKFLLRRLPSGFFLDVQIS
jgi:hypothetical protein